MEWERRVLEHLDDLENRVRSLEREVHRKNPMFAEAVAAGTPREAVAVEGSPLEAEVVEAELVAGEEVVEAVVVADAPVEAEPVEAEPVEAEPVEAEPVEPAAEEDDDEERWEELPERDSGEGEVLEAAPAPPVPPAIPAEAPAAGGPIAIRDSEGRVRLEIGLSEEADEPEPQIRLFDVDGNPRVILRVDSQGGTISVVDPDGDGFVAMRHRAASSGFEVGKDREGPKGRVFLGTQPNGPLVAIRDVDRGVQINLSVKNGKPTARIVQEDPPSRHTVTFDDAFFDKLEKL